MDSNLTEYIRSALAHGQSKEEIYKKLLNQGWKLDVIQDHFQNLKEVPDRETAHKTTIGILVTIGAVLVGAGLFSFIAANWQGLSKSFKIILILGSIVGVNALAWYLKEKYQLLKTAQALFFLGVLIYGGGIFLVGQIFNFRANWPDGFILWMIGAVAMGLAVESYLIIGLGILVSLAALVGHPFLLSESFSGSSPFLLTSSFLLLFSTVFTFWAARQIYRKALPQNRDIY